jgi:branched-subunit amino acid aminotransferase/4-amino-4-deoxychorismate lyase
MTEPFVFINGNFVPASQAHLAIYDAGLVIGATIAEMTRTFGRQPFRLEEHIARLFCSSRYTRIPLPGNPGELLRLSLELLERNFKGLEARQELGLIHFATPGPFVGYVGSAGAAVRSEPTFCIHSFPLRFSRFRQYFEEGAHVVTPSIRHLPPQCVDSKIKHRSRMHQWLADQEVHQVDPQGITLWLDLNGNITETSGSNFIIVRNDTVVAPPFRNTLPGISLLTVQELCSRLKIPFEQTDFQVYDVMNASEAMLTSTPYCLAPVTRINGAPIGKEVQGPVFRRLVTAWSELVGLDILDQSLRAE